MNVPVQRSFVPFLNCFDFAFPLLCLAFRNPKHTEIAVFVALLLLTLPFALTLHTFVEALPDGRYNEKPIL